jgi:hypothetical protein
VRIEDGYMVFFGSPFSLKTLHYLVDEAAITYLPLDDGLPATYKIGSDLPVSRIVIGFSCLSDQSMTSA